MASIEEYKKEQTCIYCSKTSICSGWVSLCNRGCYYGICDLLYLYNDGKVSEPDPRIVEYFTKYPESYHLFSDKKILAYIKGK